MEELEKLKHEIKVLTFEKSIWKGGAKALQAKLDTAIAILQKNDDVKGATHALYPVYLEEVKKLFTFKRKEK